jgi:NarL family two-component system response regulator YdfI
MSHTILIVDDSPVIRSSLRSCIAQNSDWEVCGDAENGKVALDLVQRLHPEVVLLDLSMPVMNGFDAARQIREIAPCTHIVLFTLHASPQVMEEARKLGVHDVVSKSGEGGGGVMRVLHSLSAA